MYQLIKWKHPPVDGIKWIWAEYWHYSVITAGKGTSQDEVGPAIPEPSIVRDQTTLITDDAQAFALEPIDVTHLGKILLSLW